MQAPPLDLAQARALVLAAAGPLPAEPVALADAHGRVLAREVRAQGPLPPFESSAMDGFAVKAADTLGASAERPVRLAVVSESRAGHPSGKALAAGQAIAISTGAALPVGADAIVRVEDTSRDDGSVALLAEVPAGRDVRRRGEDVQPGQTVLALGTRLGPAELGILAALGCQSPSCARRPRVRVLTTGDELLPVGCGPLAHGQIYDSSAHAVPALVRQAGGEVVGVDRAGDDPDEVLAAVEDCLDADLALICGGVSVGAHDHVKGALDALGVERVFAGVALKPGKPAWFGTKGKTLVFGLPGNPVSSLVVFVLLAAPALRAFSGRGEGALGAHAERAAMRGRLTHDYAKPPGLTHAVPCAVTTADDGTLLLTPAAKLGSHRLTSLLGAGALALIEPQRTKVQAGETAEAEPIALDGEPVGGALGGDL